MRLTPINADLMMLLAAAIWGFGFIAQKEAMNDMDPLTFNAVRFAIGALTVAPLRLLFPRVEVDGGPPDRRTLILGGLILGIVVAVASAFQQYGIVGVDAGPAGFITGLYVVFVPIFGLAIGVRTRTATWIGCLLAIAGMWFLGIKPESTGFEVDRWAILVLLGAVGWAVQVLIVSRISPRTDPIDLTVLQFGVVAVVTFLAALVFERDGMVNLASSVRGAIWEVLYSGVLAIGIAFFLQIVAQRKSPPAHVAILLSLEALFAAIGGWWLLDEQYDQRTILGCGLMFAGIVASQVPRIIRSNSSDDNAANG